MDNNGEEFETFNASSKTDGQVYGTFCSTSSIMPASFQEAPDRKYTACKDSGWLILTLALACHVTLAYFLPHMAWVSQTFDDQQLFAETFGIVFLTGLCIPMIIFAKYYEGTGARLGPAFCCFGSGCLLSCLMVFMLTYQMVLLRLNFVEGVSVLEVSKYGDKQAFYFTDGFAATKWEEKYMDHRCHTSRSDNHGHKGGTRVCNDVYFVAAPVFPQAECYPNPDFDTSMDCTVHLMGTSDDPTFDRGVDDHSSCNGNRHRGLCAYYAPSWGSYWTSPHQSALCQDIVKKHDLVVAPADLCSRRPLTIGDYRARASRIGAIAKGLAFAVVPAYVLCVLCLVFKNFNPYIAVDQ